MPKAKRAKAQLDWRTEIVFDLFERRVWEIGRLHTEAWAHFSDRHEEIDREADSHTPEEMGRFYRGETLGAFYAGEHQEISGLMEPNQEFRRSRGDRKMHARRFAEFGTCGPICARAKSKILAYGGLQETIRLGRHRDYA